ncbi:MAG TPA: ABC transporter substrate-binding protein [Chloroflexota bacterium]|jgi:ABC-type nitrate/sulfonate/bicarbonate transport system substrate-binding protein
MRSLRMLYRDVDRMPYLAAMRYCARRYDLELEIVRAQPGGGWAELLAQDDVQVIAENYWGLQSERARGLPFVTFGSAVRHWNEKLVVAPGIRSLDDLRGKTLALRTPGPQELLPRLWLRDMGLAGDMATKLYTDPEVGRWGHWRKVADGECQAFFITYLYAQAALDAGLRELPYDTYYFEGGNVTLTTTEGVIRERRQDVQDSLNAAFDATHLFKTDAATTLRLMREETLDLLREHLEIPDDAALERVYHILRDELSPIPVPTAAGIDNAWRMRLDTAPGLRDFNPLLMWDFSFAREALAQSRGARA